MRDLTSLADADPEVGKQRNIEHGISKSNQKENEPAGIVLRFGFQKSD